MKQGTTAVSEQVDEFGDVVDAPLEGRPYVQIGKILQPNIVNIFFQF